jgi:hypothetical protein
MTQLSVCQNWIYPSHCENYHQIKTLRAIVLEAITIIYGIKGLTMAINRRPPPPRAAVSAFCIAAVVHSLAMHQREHIKTNNSHATLSLKSVAGLHFIGSRCSPLSF